MENNNIIDYKDKSIISIGTGEDFSITIDNKTEYFRVLSNNNGKITAVPHYNISLDETPIQTSIYDDTTRIAFSDNENPMVNTHFMVGDAISMYHTNIQQYIKAYCKKLSDNSEGRITARIALKNEMYPKEELISMSNNISVDKIRNPSQLGEYWLGSAVQDDDIYGLMFMKYVYTVSSTRKCY